MPAIATLRPLLWASLLGFISAVSASASLETVGETVVLPKIEVTEKRLPPEPESWSYAQIEGFEVLSNASEGNTRRMINDFQMFRQALQVAWPMPQRPLFSQSLILCGQGAKFDDFIPQDSTAPEGVSLFLRNWERAAIVVDVQRVLVSPDQADMTLASEGAVDVEVSPHRQLYREYVRFLLSGSDAAMPPWLQEGLLQIVMDIEFTDKWVFFGKIDRGNDRKAGAGSVEEGAGTEDQTVSANAVVPDRQFNLALQKRRLLPLDEFFAVTPNPLLASNPANNTLWTKQAYAFVHLCLYGRAGKFQKPFARLLQRTHGGPVTEEIFEECFGLGFKEMGRELRAYISFTDHKYQVFKLKGDSRFEVAEFLLREASQGEIARIKGSAQHLAGLTTAARDTLHAAYVRGERDPYLLADLGVLEQADGKHQNARAFIGFALRTGQAPPSARVALARAELAGLRADSAKSGRAISPAQVAPILDLLLATRLLRPALPETYLAMAETWAACALIPSPEQLAILDEGIRFFPRESGLLLQAVKTLQSAGAPDRAAGVARLGARFASDPGVRDEFERLAAGFSPKP